MEKLVYLALASSHQPLRDDSDILAAARDAFAPERYRAVSIQLPRRDVEEARALARGVVLQHVHDDHDATVASEPQQLVALVSLWVDCADDRGDADAFVASLGDVRGYAVTESVAHWIVDPDGNGPPEAVKAVTVMRPPWGVDRDELVRHWCDVHMPMSLRIHPQWSYVRNVVVRSLFADEDLPAAVAEQGFAHPGDIIDGRRFYGAVDDESYEANRAEILADVPKFLDPTTTMTFVTQEHVLRHAWKPLRMLAPTAATSTPTASS